MKKVSLVSGIRGILSVILVLASCFAHADLDEQLSKVTTRVKDAISASKIGGNVNLISLKPADFAKLGIEAGLETWQNDDKVTYSRSEKLVFSKALKFRTPGPVFLESSIEKDSEVEFIRQFDSQIDALNLVTHPPYLPTAIPTTAYKALDLEQGDYVRFQSRMALSVGAGVGKTLGIAGISGARKYIIYGDFQIEVYRKEDQKVGLRLSSLQKNSKTLGLKLGHDHVLDVFAVVGLGEANQNLLTKKFNERISERILPSKIIDLGVNTSNGSLVSIEYEFNMVHVDAVDAFEKVVNPLKWEYSRHVQILARNRAYRRHLLTVNADAAEKLVGLKYQGEPLVRRTYQGESQFTEKTKSLKISLPFIQNQNGQSYLEQDFQFQGEDGPRSYLKLAQLTIKNSIEVLLELIGLEQEKEANILFETNAQGEVIDFHELNFSYSREETLHLFTERARVQGQVYKMLPENYHSQFELGKIAGTILDRDVNIFIHSTFHKKAFQSVYELTERDLDRVVNHFFKIIADDQTKASFGKHYGSITVYSEPGSEQTQNWRERAEPHFPEFKRILKRTLLKSSGLTPYERWDEMRKLSQDPFFQQLGSGVFIRLAEYAARKFHQDFESLVAFELRMESASGQSVNKTLGDPEKSEVMRKVLTARDRILGRKLKRVYW